MKVTIGRKPILRILQKLSVVSVVMVICPANPKHKQRHDKIEREKNGSYCWSWSSPKMTNVVVSRTYVYGIGLPTSKKILAAAGVSEDIRVKDLQSNKKTRYPSKCMIKVEADLRRRQT